MKNSVIAERFIKTKWGLLMFNQKHTSTLILKTIINILNSKLVIRWEYQNINIFAKGYTPNCLEEVLVLKKFKVLYRGSILLVILNFLNVLLKGIVKYKLLYVDTSLFAKKDDLDSLQSDVNELGLIN